jgi:hypothetical protein
LQKGGQQVKAVRNSGISPAILKAGCPAEEMMNQRCQKAGHIQKTDPGFHFLVVPGFCLVSFCEKAEVPDQRCKPPFCRTIANPDLNVSI